MYRQNKNKKAYNSINFAYAHHIIMGDFNTDITHRTSRCFKFLQVVESHGMKILTLQPTHHNSLGLDTWLDLIFTSAPTLVRDHGLLEAPTFSIHDLIFIFYVLKPPKLQPRNLYMRGFARMVVDKLCRDAFNLNRDAVTLAVSVDEKVNNFNNTVLGLYNIHAPVRK